MKGSIRIGGAVAMGIVIILGALHVNATTAQPQEAQVVVAVAPERTYIEATDSDNDGIKDWEESLGIKAITPPAPNNEAEGAEPYEEPTTFTGKFSEAFFQDYLQGKINGQDFSDPSLLVGNAVTAIEENTQSKRRSRLELTIVPATFEAMREYGNRIPEIVVKYQTGGVNEVTILKQALDTNDPAVLAKLAPIREAYVGMINDMLKMSVPDSFVNEHLALLNAYEAILTDIEAMEKAFDDPLYALARVRKYYDDVTAMANSFKAMGEALGENGITYANDELGAFFYLFDI